MQPDVWLYQIIVAVLSVTLVRRVAGTPALSIAGQSTLEVTVALGSAAIGGLTGSSTPSPLNQ